VADYLKDHNGAQAAIRAGYSRKTAKEQASRLLTKVHVTAAVRPANARSAPYTRRTRLAFGSLTGPSSSQWTAEMAAAVARVEVVIKNAKAGDDITERVLKIRFWNKNAAIELDYKSFGLIEPEPDDAGRDVPTFVFPEERQNVRGDSFAECLRHAS
jgi:phage terminase small subunit